ncbi:MAG TPA: hypothetical protein VM390_12800, partial [Acidimicrobiales bacterium]|nr:hypothetical protein [Acidimicrobiales bacterium]
MIRLDAATVLLQWATGGLFFLWVTTRRRQVGVGYGWLLRGVYGGLAALSVLAGLTFQPYLLRDGLALMTTAAALAALGVSVVRRKAGVAGERARRRRRAARVQAMVGDRVKLAEDDPDTPEFPPTLDLV